MFAVSVKGVFCAPSGEVILLLNERDEWELPGGRIEIGENSLECLKREIREELSLEVKVEAPIDTYLFEVVPCKHVFVAKGCRMPVRGQLLELVREIAPGRRRAGRVGLNRAVKTYKPSAQLTRVLTRDCHANQFCAHARFAVAIEVVD
jgi:hypothetical protein